jgi:hypothetical protein
MNGKLLAIFLIAMMSMNSVQSYGNPLMGVITTLAYIKYAIFGGRNPIFNPIFLDDTSSCLQAGSPEQSKAFAAVFASVEQVLSAQSPIEFNPALDNFVSAMRAAINVGGERIAACVKPDVREYIGTIVDYVLNNPQEVKDLVSMIGVDGFREVANQEQIVQALGDDIAHLVNH